MRFLIQTMDGEIKHDFAFTLIESIRYQKWAGSDMSYALCDFRDIKAYKSSLIPIGSVEFVSEFLSIKFGLTPKPINVPECLFKFAGRKIANVSLLEMSEFIENNEECFVKSNEKIKGYSGINHIGDIIPSGNYQCSTIIDIDSEYRCFVHRGNLVGIQHYLGDFRLFPDLNMVDKMIAEFIDAPIAYTLDVGISSGNTIVVEVHDFFSCGLYGFSNHKILPFMFSHWMHEYKTKNGLK